MSGFKQVENLEDGSELEADVSIQMKRSTLKKTAVALATAMVVCVGIFAWSTNGFSRGCSNVGALQGKSSLDLNSAIRSTSEKLIQATKNNQTLADETVLKAMVKAGRKVQDHWEKPPHPQIGHSYDHQKGERIPPRTKGQTCWNGRMLLQHLGGICLSGGYG